MGFETDGGFVKRNERFSLLAELGCIICGQPAQIHHLIGVKYRGMGQKADNEYTIPLCASCHTGKNGIHQIGKKTWEARYGTQEELLIKTNKKLENLF